MQAEFFPLWIYIHIVGAQITAPHRDLFIVKKKNQYDRVKDRVKNMYLHIFNLCICGTYTQYTQFVCLCLCFHFRQNHTEVLKSGFKG